jgi:hypothetical protein
VEELLLKESMLLLIARSLGYSNQRQAYIDWGPCLPVGPACWTMGTDNLKLCTIGKKLCCTGPTGSAVHFFMLPLPSKIHRLNSVNTRLDMSLLVFCGFSGKFSGWATV